MDGQGVAIRHAATGQLDSCQTENLPEPFFAIVKLLAASTELLLGAITYRLFVCGPTRMTVDTRTMWAVPPHSQSGRRWAAGSAQPFGLWGGIRSALSLIGACGCSTSSKFLSQPEKKKKLGNGRRDLVKRQEQNTKERAAALVSLFPSFCPVAPSLLAIGSVARFQQPQLSGHTHPSVSKLVHSSVPGLPLAVLAKLSS
jgi:hypothetical protein